MPLPHGTRLGPFEITRAIGAGGMGEVYRARDPRHEWYGGMLAALGRFDEAGTLLKRLDLESAGATGR
jgi:serine/threonine protein kinase